MNDSFQGSLLYAWLELFKRINRILCLRGQYRWHCIFLQVSTTPHVVHSRLKSLPSLQGHLDRPFFSQQIPEDWQIPLPFNKKRRKKKRSHKKWNFFSRFLIFQTWSLEYLGVQYMYTFLKFCETNSIRVQNDVYLSVTQSFRKYIGAMILIIKNYMWP